MLTHHDIQEVLRDIQFGDWAFDVRFDPGGAYLRVRFAGPCNSTGRLQTWEGRDWPLSLDSSRSEIVRTAFKAVMTALEHEARERFRYQGEAIFGPHFDCDLLVELCRRSDAPDTRDEAA